ncbi:chemotaxis protein CheW [Vibrio coralliilyticus]|jgi:purine-binding chemotaxis protein CheW|uniref:Chemotaxis protein CheW n=1 Tax=Vibrio coralliilyticus TaxID=190893 RepID=A0A097AZN6_9VIBR|nr:MULTISPECIES: chemotaxis protein CheW [Vibrio]AIS57876.1 chemotaxis protein CheW [Vibrio coralliilyticus]AIW22163.1 chemotaxis protein CheW [Vibrio coralliilyticus]ANW26619.1 chemotaxis protein CheW [Vibrio coralliilyticus]AXN33858.1 chemotaxis protein CheW [Vibrio coralliilyticus]KFI13079.1 chemotaxis protein CheW [Vibrio sp. B183]
MIIPQEFLSFVLGDDEYGVPILDVREVRGWSSVREVPNSPDYMLGVLEIRGEYVPIVDLRSRFGLPPAQISATTVVIVLNDAEMHPLGIIVDGVSEVYPLTDEQIKPAPHVSHSVDHSYIRGIASVENGHLILIKLEALFDVSELVVPDQNEESWA